MINELTNIIESVSEQPEAPVILARKSWTAWIGWAIVAAFILLAVVPVLWRSARAAAVIVALVMISCVTYNVAVARSYVLFMNNEGIWLRRGILPWNKGVVGVKWRDLDGALYFTNFISWATNSYTVHLGHRFTKTSEIHISHMRAGNKAVELINAAHADMIRRAG